MRHDEKHNKNISKALKGRKLDDKHKENLSKAMSGRTPWNKGLHGYQAGEKHYNWRGGVTAVNRLIRNSLKYKQWREKIFKRDDYTCLSCEDRGVEIHPHHIDSFAKYPEYRFDISNGITLCKPCHYFLHSK